MASWQSLNGRAALLALAWAAGFAFPVSAQVNCPVGYTYAYGYGCRPVGGGYGAFYGGAPYGGFAPAYDSFGLAYGQGYGGGFRGGGFRGGEDGFHGGGFHGGGGFGGGHGGGGHR